MITVTNLLLEDIINIAWQAAAVVNEIYLGVIEYSNKADGSPLTRADIASHNIITQKLQALIPDTRIISEENTEWNDEVIKSNQFWLIDPLDGTKEFINRNGEFTINIALIEAGRPILGVVCAPALNVLYGGLQDQGAFKMNQSERREPIAALTAAEEGLLVVGSRSHNDQTAMDNFLEKKKVANFINMGSSLKFCYIAEGGAHIYPRLGRTMEWDTAAGHAVLAAAGGQVSLLDGGLMHYGKKGYENPHFIAHHSGFQEEV